MLLPVWWWQQQYCGDPAGNVTEYKIQGVDEDTDYSVQVWVVILNSTESTLTFEYANYKKGSYKCLGKIVYKK